MVTKMIAVEVMGVQFDLDLYRYVLKFLTFCYGKCQTHTEVGRDKFNFPTRYTMDLSGVSMSDR